MKPLFAPLLVFCAPAAFALDGLYFTHKDWELACDNTGTCRAAGYQSEDYSSDAGLPPPVSILLTRAAGANSTVRAQLSMMSEQLDAGGNEMLPAAVTLGVQSEWYDKDADMLESGTVTLNKDGTGELSAAQTAFLLKALPQKDTAVYFVGDNQETPWRLSTQGSTAILLKMDDFQKRVNTPSALIKPGNSSAAVLAPEPVPTLVYRVPTGDIRTLSADSAEYRDFVHLFRDAFNSDGGCGTGMAEKKDIALYPLGNDRYLSEMPCWLSAYNAGNYYAIVSADLKTIHADLQKTLKRDDFNGYHEGILSAEQKGRGMGDCWQHVEYVYDGENFVLSADVWNGLCRGFPGGAWELPQYVSERQAAN